MTVIALGSLKASPGVTTSALALASTWPEHRRVLIAELDTGGGDLAARFGLKQQPGLVSLAAVGRREQRAEAILEHCQQLCDGVDVLVAPPSSSHTRTALHRGATLLASIGDLDDVDVLLDMGRLDATSPNWSLLAHADLTVVVTRPVLGELQHVATITDALRQQSAEVAVLLVGNGPYSQQEISESLKIDVLSVFPHDVGSADALNGGHAGSKRLTRRPLLRAARSFAMDIVARGVVGVDDESVEASA